jgi:hypothetical protein
LVTHSGRPGAAAEEAAAEAQGPHPAAVPSGSPSWDSPELRALSAELAVKRLEFAKAATKGTLYMERDFLERALLKRFPREELRTLARSFNSTPPCAKDWTDFQSQLFWSMLEGFMHSGDREGAVLLLSTRCSPSFFGADRIEDDLLAEDMGEGMQYKVKERDLLLFEAFSRCRTPEVRAEIAAAIRRGFTGLGVGGEDDADFVANALKWYNRNHTRFKHNERYQRNFGVVYGRPDDYLRNPLYVERTEGGGKPEKVGERSGKGGASTGKVDKETGE